jgi:hypothetical protein
MHFDNFCHATVACGEPNLNLANLHMSSILHECRWKDCRREFTNDDQFKAHVMSHLDMHDPVRVKDIPDYRRAIGYPGSTGAILASIMIFDKFSNQIPFLIIYFVFCLFLTFTFLLLYPHFPHLKHHHNTTSITSVPKLLECRRLSP